MTSMLDREYNDSVLLESLVEDIREFTDWMEVSEGKGGYSLRKGRVTPWGADGSGMPP